ncbi:HEAT repeat domain-containing protein [Alkalicoccus halolimnae]|uniref:HEAT repeat domain-containing protein n=1 Tax=Alkalicoccus halolimnae TaxID=1667239 RepID=A0A5C7FNF5_9BACI|nr:HEAT repeat domain-containing protein [Alkalicoccus halolimnae]TXF86856.1 hypothetical protein FTX54_02730 [Alkalicoccus halolimnae]
MVWAWWLILIFLLVQLVLLGYLLIIKSASLRYDARLQKSYRQLLPAFIAYASGDIEEKPVLPREPKLRREVLEMTLSRLASLTEESEERLRLYYLSEVELLPFYEKSLKKGGWAERMNTMYFIEDFRLDYMADAVAARERKLRENGEEYRQAVRTMASLSHPRAIDCLFDDRPKSLTFVKEILRRLSAEQLALLHSRINPEEEQDSMILQAFLVHIGERNEVSFISYVEEALQHESKEIRLKAMKSLCFYQYMKHPEKIQSFFDSEHWEERMYACKVAAALSMEPWRKELMDRLGDSAWWVRLAAAETLWSFSDGGILLEYAKEKHEDRYGRDMAAQVLTMHTEVKA